MTTVRKLVLGGAGLAALAIAGAVAAASFHTLHIALPGGGSETITYVGDTPPKVRFAPGSAMALAPIFDPFASDPVFAQMDRVAAEMDARAAAMMRAAESSRGFSQTGLGNLPPGVTGYSVVSTYSGGRSCVRTTQYLAGERGAAPKILTSASPGCGETARPERAAPAPVTVPTTPRSAAPTTEVRWDGRPATRLARD